MKAVTLLALCLLLPGAAAWPSVFFHADDLTYGVEIDYATYPSRTLTLWQGDGKGTWWPTPIRYRLYFDHSWFSEWRGIGTGARLYVIMVGRNTLVLHDPDILWFSDVLRRLDMDQ